MLLMSSLDRMGLPQNVHGPSPSLTQIIFPQFMQFGAMLSNGCRVAMHVQRRFAVSAAVFADAVSEGLVCNSRLLIAESRSDKVVLAPCMAVPPEILIFVFAGAGEEVREVLVEAGRESEINGPEADGGGLGETVREAVVDLGIGNCTASGLSCNASAVANCGSFFLCREDPAM